MAYKPGDTIEEVHFDDDASVTLYISLNGGVVLDVVGELDDRSEVSGIERLLKLQDLLNRHLPMLTKE